MSSETVELKREMQDDYNYKEAIKTLRTNIQFCGSSIRAVLFTSSLPDEGKSDISFALAESLAQIGKKTILIDADIRKSILVDRYQLRQEVAGLSQYLSGQKALEDVIYKTNEENLSVILQAPIPPTRRSFWRKSCAAGCLRPCGPAMTILLWIRLPWPI